MLGEEFLKHVKGLASSDDVNVEEYADRFNFQITVIILMLCTTITTYKQYITKPIACYLATDVGGKNLLQYVEHYCWVQGTIPIAYSDQIPADETSWDKLEEQKLSLWVADVYDTYGMLWILSAVAHYHATKKITSWEYWISVHFFLGCMLPGLIPQVYYQWVPFLLGIQTILFYVPHLVWKVLSNCRAGGVELRPLMINSHQAVQADPEQREKLITQVVKTLREQLFRDDEPCTDEDEELIQQKTSVWKCWKHILPRKRMSMFLFFTYMFVKFIYLVNSVGQLFLMQSYLGVDKGNYTLFGGNIVGNILQGNDWEVTLVFPRVGYCIVPIRHMGALNYVAAQCVLPVNMLNERIYVFLWFWLTLVSIINGFSIPLWYAKIIYRRNETFIIKKYLRLKEVVKDDQKVMLTKFQNRFLNHDGLFILDMISRSSGDLICSDIVHKLWIMFKVQQEVCQVDNDKKRRGSRMWNFRFNRESNEREPMPTIAESEMYPLRRFTTFAPRSQK